ncbi:MAG: Gfo/Idh/MocA family protein [Chloroflexota bacterium]
MDKVRIGILGAGLFACYSHIPRLLATGEVELTAVCRRSSEALQKVGDHFGIPRRYTDYGEMLDDAPLDAVVVSSPHALHYEHVRAVLQHGFAVLTDKPLAIHLAEAEALKDLAAAKGLTLMVAAGPPYDAAHRYMQGRIVRGDLGIILLAQVYALTNVDALGFFGRAAFPDSLPVPVPPTDFRAHLDLGGGGYFQDVGILAVTGLQPVEVNATFDAAEVELRPSVTIRFGGGAVATITQFADANPEHRTLVDLSGTLFAGSKGSLSKDSRTGKLLFQGWDLQVEQVPDEALPPKSSPDQNFVGVLRGREAALFPTDLAVETVRVVEAAYRSAREGQTVHLGDRHTTVRTP